MNVSCVINIRTIKINTMASNASLNIGSVFQSNHSAVSHNESKGRFFIKHTQNSTGSETHGSDPHMQAQELIWKIEGHTDVS
jgi:hypothetical protein